MATPYTLQAMAVENFGAVGDGLTDNTQAFINAINTVSQLILGPNTYVVNSALALTSANAIGIVGVPGKTTIICNNSSLNATWISITAPSIIIQNVCFNANLKGTSPHIKEGVVINSSCTESKISQCTFTNFPQGTACLYKPSNSPEAMHTFSNNIVSHCLNGMWCEAANNFICSDNTVMNISNNGIEIQYTNTGTQTYESQLAIISNNTVSHCLNGIVVGDYNKSSYYDPATLTNLSPDTMLVSITHNTTSFNSQYGIVAQGYGLLISDNTIYNNGTPNKGVSGGLLSNNFCSLVKGNYIFKNHSYGIDAGGSNYSHFTTNYINGNIGVGINVGGGVGVTITNNSIGNNSYVALLFYQIETDGSNNVIGVGGSDASISGNTFNLLAGSRGIQLLDGPPNMSVTDNKFFVPSGYDVSLCVLALTDSVMIKNNAINNLPFMHLYDTFTNNVGEFNGLTTFMYVDALDEMEIRVTSPTPIQSLVSLNQSNYAQYVTFLRVVNGGTGYTTPPTVSFSGGGGSGATATAYILNGAVVGFRMHSLGTGYTSAPTVTLTGGNGSGAVVQAFINAPLSDGRRVRIRNMVQNTWSPNGSNPPLVTPNNQDIVSPANSEIEWVAREGSWYLSHY